MRRSLPALVLLLVAACGSGSGGSAQQTVSQDPLSVLRATSTKTTSAGSSKMTLSSTTTLAGQEIVFGGTGAFQYAPQIGSLDLTFDLAGQKATFQERILDGKMYLQVPGQPGWYAIDLTAVVGTSLASSADPTASLAQLVGVSAGVQEVGTETVRGEQTTHYKGTIDPAKAIKELDGFAKSLAETGLKGVTSIPFDVYVDGEGRTRKFVETIALTVQGKKGTSTTTIELYDFGTKVSVVAPPAAEVKDGTPFLDQLKTG